MDRRDFLKRSGLAATALMIGNTSLGRLWSSAAVAGPGPYGDLLAPNADGIQLPAGFTSRLIGVSGQPVGNTGYLWHGAPDGGAVFPAPAGGWVYVSNSEVSGGAGGVSAVRFDQSGNIIRAQSILKGTTRNCAGGVTPQGTWLSCEENGVDGRVYECDPLGIRPAVMRPLLGSFNHEAAFVDPVSGIAYLTEDDPVGRFYRFVPTTPGDLSSGQLFAAQNDSGTLRWVATNASAPDRSPSTTPFSGGEGIWIDNGILYFTTKYDIKVWKLILATQAISVFYDGQATPGAALNAVDNVTVHAPSSDVYVAEDGGNMELCVFAAMAGKDEVAPFLRFVGHDQSEVTGPAFTPDHRRLYVSSQRGTDGKTGRTYEITGPFRAAATPGTAPVTAPVTVLPIASTSPASLVPAHDVETTFVSLGSMWRYRDRGAIAGSAWRIVGFNDRAWAQGRAPLGFGDPMATTIGFGPNPDAKYVTTYFRTSFRATNGVSKLTLTLRRDDGAIVYLNGREVARSNMASGTVTADALALVVIGGSDETAVITMPIVATLRRGTNVIAVEVHQAAVTSSDLAFDLSLTGTGNTGRLR